MTHIQGGAAEDAEAGVKRLAGELAAAWDGSDGGVSGDIARFAEGQRLVVAVPSGTGTTALFLARHLRHNDAITVLAVPCVGPASYLRRQMQRLDHATGAVGAFPNVLEGRKPAPFGEPRAELLKVWRQLQEDSELYVDLLYGARTWEVLFESWRRPDGPFAGAQVLYYHTGGLEGVSSQLNRYKHKGLVGSHQAM